jgi:cysteine desulfurase/selenocysteine lyase
VSANAPAQALTLPLDAGRLREDFPILRRQVGGHPLTYLDSAATSQKPVAVTDAITGYYQHSNANVHRGVHTLGNEATDVLENARVRVARFIDGAPEGLVFVRNTTEALNLVAWSYTNAHLKPGDRIVLSEMEHHSNLVPWQLVADAAGLELAFIPMTGDCQLDMEEALRLLDGPTKLLSITHQSNVLGTINDVATLAREAHARGVRVCVDAAQSVPHIPVSVAALDCDFLAFSGHKMLGPMGIGALWVRPELLEGMPPFLGGGSMILKVELEKSTWNAIPHRFEAGTPDVAGAAGLAAACDYLDAVGMDRVHQHELALTGLLLDMLADIPAVTVQGPASREARGGAVSFSVAGVHPHDVGTVLDRQGVAVRAGHHCCQPLMRALGVPATTRASVYLYNDAEDVEALRRGLLEVTRIFGVPDGG